jgi:hypothetical protein
MDQRPNDRIPPRQDDPLGDESIERPSRTGWERVTRTEEGAWNYIPLLLVAALIAIGGWLLMAADRTATPTPKTFPTPRLRRVPRPIQMQHRNQPRRPRRRPQPQSPKRLRREREEGSATRRSFSFGLGRARHLP